MTLFTQEIHPARSKDIWNKISDALAMLKVEKWVAASYSTITC